MYLHPQNMEANVGTCSVQMMESLWTAPSKCHIQSHVFADQNHRVSQVFTSNFGVASEPHWAKNLEDFAFFRQSFIDELIPNLLGFA